MNAKRAALLLPLAALVAFVAPAAGADANRQPTRATVKAADGLTIAYDVRGGGDTALVFLHGWCCDRESWKHQLDAFANDYRVVAIDLGGHGESGKDRKEWSVIGLAGDVEAVVKTLDLKRVVLVGHSMGGTVSLETARRMPGVVVGVVGVDTLQNAEREWPAEQAKAILAAFEADFATTMRGAIRGMLPEKHDPQLAEWIATKAAAQDKTMALGLFRDFPRIDMKVLFRDAKVPVRCINAVPSSQFATPTATDVNRKYANFDAVLMEGVGHYPMLEKPAEFNQKLRQVLTTFQPRK